MSNKPSRSRGFTIYLAVLIVLLILACVLFFAASAEHATREPHIREHGLFALALNAAYG